MLFFIIFGILLILSIIVIIMDLEYWYTEFLYIIGVLVCAVCVIVLLLLTMFACINAAKKDINYQDYLAKREVLEYRLNHQDENIVGNEMLYSDIVDFNEKIRHCKKYAYSVWLGVFTNEKIATLDYITIGEVRT